MTKMKTVLIAFGVILFGVNQLLALRHACYYTNWSRYRNGPGFFDTSLLDPTVCSHIIYSFSYVDDNGNVIPQDPWNDIGDDWNEGQFQKLSKMKAATPGLKTLIACGGWTFGSTVFSKVANDPQKRTNFVNSAAAFTKQYGFDGFDLDWEYPGVGSGSNPNDKQAFSDLLRELRAKFNEEGLLLTAAISSSPASIDISYDVPVLSENVDFINFMSYDLHGSWEPVTGHVAPLYYGDYLANQTEKALYVEAIVDNLIAKGADPQKINLGVVSYGRTFTLADPNNKGFGAPSTGPGNGGKFVSEQGMLAYNEICYEQGQNLWEDHFDDQQGVPYSVKGNQWAGYEDRKSIGLKIDFLRSRNLGGTVLWSIDTDDFAGTCFGNKFPLQGLIRDSLQ